MKLVAYSMPGESLIRRGVVLDGNKVLEIRGDFKALDPAELAKIRELSSSPEATRYASLSLDEVVLHPPIPDPEKILCIGLNYRDHCEESNLPIPDHPVLFAKYRNALVGHRGAIRFNGVSMEIDYEAELAFVVGKRASRVSEAEALDYVAGYISANDVSARDLQFSDNQ